MITRKISKLIFSLFVIFSNDVFAQKVYMTIADTATEFKILVSVIQKPCDKKDGNATGLTGNGLVVGCWNLEGTDIKIKWFDIEQTNVYPVKDFKLITEVKPNSN